MEKNRKSDRIESLKHEFEKGVAFHANSFREIDVKAKYWLTLTIPAFIGLLGYGFQKGNNLSVYLAAIIASISVCLIGSIYFLSKTLGSVRVESGILSPGDDGFDSAEYFLESEKNWLELKRDQAKAMSDAFVLNDHQNTKKSRNLFTAEKILFTGLPTAACLAVGATAICSTLLDTTSCPRWLPTAGATSGIAIGVAIGTCLTAIFIFAHLRPSKSKFPDNYK